jgi:hypothetical protein
VPNAASLEKRLFVRLDVVTGGRNCNKRGAGPVLARAAIEVPIRKAASRQFGEGVVAQAGLFKILEDYAVRGRLLSKDGLGRAHKIRVAADKVLHQQPTDVDEVLGIIEAARSVVLELERQKFP